MKTLTRLAFATLLMVSTVAVSLEASRAADQKQPAYVASVNREPFHKPSCEWAKKISPQNLATFQTRNEAIKAGHRSCKVCHP